MQKFIRLAAAGGMMALGLSGCATITQGTSDPFALTTTPVSGAKCELKNGVGTWYITTPGTVEVHKSKTDLVIDCSHDGFKPAHEVVASKFEGMTAGNLILGGAIGIGVDAASGAMNHYPKSVDIEMEPLEAAAATTPAPTPPAEPQKTSSLN